MKLFKQPGEKAEIEFREAYEKGVNLGPEKWLDAVNHFSEASKHYAEVGDVRRSAESVALAHLFYALSTRTEQAWQNVSQAMNKVPQSQLNVGFPVNSSNIARQASVLSHDLATTRELNAESRDVSRVVAIRSLAEQYMDLIGDDLAVWRLMNQEIDPQRRAYYLLGLASLIEANNVADSDPTRSVALLSEATANMELAATDPMALTPVTKAKLEDIAKLGKCWFCGREMQGQNFHFVLLQAELTRYTREQFGSGAPPSIEGDAIVACEGCSSSIRNVADEVAKAYYRRALAEMRAVEQRLSTRIDALQTEVKNLHRRVDSLR